MTDKRPHTFLVIDGGLTPNPRPPPPTWHAAWPKVTTPDAASHAKLFYSSLMQQMEAMERSGVFPKTTVILMAELAIEHYRKGTL